MMRVNLILLAAVLASAFYLVNLQYQSRTVYTAMDKAQAAARRLETERDTLEVVKRAQTASLRVESVARTQLGMREANPGITQYVTLQGDKVNVSAPPAAPASAIAAARRHEASAARRQP